MPEQPPPAATYPADLLADQLRMLSRKGSPVAAALQARSAYARALFLPEVLGGTSCLADQKAEDLVADVCVRLLDAATARRADPEVLGDLARVLALQDLQPGDPAAAMVLLDTALDAFGPRRIAADHQGFHGQLAFHLGDRERAADLLRVYRRVPETIRANLLLDLANPFGGGHGDVPSWLDGFQTRLPAARLNLVEGDGPALDRLRAVPAGRATDGHRITTIVTAFRPGEPLITAVRSLVAQSWTNHEVLVVDDGSPPEFDAALRRCAELDPRIRVIKLPANGGTYVARNAGLDAASGEYVTFQDSDDWSHPRRLEHQVKPLLADRGLVCTTSVGMRVTENLVISRLGYPDHRSFNLSSMMFRRDAVLRRLGYLDLVRKGADAEYLERVRAVFGRRAVRHLTGLPYALIRLSPDSLSGADISSGWLHPARRAYLSAFMAWHRRIADGGTDPLRPKHPQSRPFPVPRHLCATSTARPATAAPPTAAQTSAAPAPVPPAAVPPAAAPAALASATATARGARYDIVLAGDWTTGGCAPATSAAGQIQALRRRDLRIAVLHLDVLTNLAGGWRYLDTEIQNLINDGVVEPVIVSDPVEAPLAVVRDPAALLFPPTMQSQLRVDRVVIQADRPPYEGSRPWYAPAVCAASARRLFGPEPLWCPSGPLVRGALAAHHDHPRLAAADLRTTIQTERWHVDRTRPKADRPVLGRVLGLPGGAAGPVDGEGLLEVFGRSARLDVRLFDGTDGVLRGASALPRSWLLYGRDDVTDRGFLHQLDFYVHAPDDGGAVLEPAVRAMAAGCVVLLSPRYEGTFGDAAVYCEPAQVKRTVRRYHRAPAKFLAQSRRARQHARKHWDHEAYADTIANLALAPRP